MFSCHKNMEQHHATETDTLAVNDSNALRIAILPIKECKVLQYAQQSGIARKMGLNMKLIQFESLMDIDTSLHSNCAHIYFEDSKRIEHYRLDTVKRTKLMSIPTELTLIANKDKNIKKISDLNAKIVGLTRSSELETWMKNMTDTSLTENQEVYHAQINSIRLRTDMLNNALVDAAILPQPWADSLTAYHGHHILSKCLADGFGFYSADSILSDSLLKEQILLFKKVYVEALNKLSTD